MYKEVIYKTNNPTEVFGMLVKVSLSEIGMFYLFNVGPFCQSLLKRGYMRIYGDDEQLVIKVANRFEQYIRTLSTRVRVLRIK